MSLRSLAGLVLAAFLLGWAVTPPPVRLNHALIMQQCAARHQVAAFYVTPHGNPTSICL